MKIFTHAYKVMMGPGGVLYFDALVIVSFIPALNSLLPILIQNEFLLFSGKGTMSRDNLAILEKVDYFRSQLSTNIFF